MDSRIKELFERYQSGKASDNEKRLVEDWFAAFDSEQQKDFNEEQNTKLFTKMDREIYNLTGNHPARYQLPVRWLQVAAIFLIGAGIILFKVFRNNRSVPVSYTLISAPRGIKKQFSLPDGSSVFLNSGSSLRISSDFGIKNRLVSLSGEAFFMVKHNKTKPFTIRSGRLIITDIGTSFNVKAYPGENQTKVAVESGEVNVKKSNLNKDTTTLSNSITRNQQLIYNNDSQRYTLNNAQTSEISAWRNNKLRFDNASFSEIATTLERWYNVTIKLNDSTDQHHRYTVSFNNEPVSNVLRVLEKLSGMTYQINNKSIQINLKPNKKT